MNRHFRRYAEYGFGLWAVVLKETNEMIGQCGLTFQSWRERELLEIGYLFQKAYCLNTEILNESAYQVQYWPIFELTTNDLIGCCGLRPYQANEYEIGFASFFHNFSTFLGRAGIYLEDLYVRPEYRGKGYGKAILKKLAAIAVERNCGRYLAGTGKVTIWKTRAGLVWKKKNSYNQGESIIAKRKDFEII